MIITATCEEFDARIIIGDEDTYYSDLSPQSDTYYIDGSLAAGRIELCLRGVWNPVCQDVWTEAEAAVACHQLGFSRYGTNGIVALVFSDHVVCCFECTTICFYAYRSFGRKSDICSHRRNAAVNSTNI